MTCEIVEFRKTVKIFAHGSEILMSEAKGNSIPINRITNAICLFISIPCQPLDDLNDMNIQEYYNPPSTIT
jgi:hypothetical protein